MGLIQLETHSLKVGNDRVGYHTLGNGPHVLVLTYGWWGAVDHTLEDPAAGRFFRRLASFTRLVLADCRGSSSGLSDPRPADGRDRWSHWAEDLLAIIGAVKAESVALLSNLAPEWALQFAAACPQHCAKLILVNGTARISAAPGYPEGLAPETLASYLAFTEKCAGTDRWTLAINPSLANNEQTRQWFSRFALGFGSPKEAMELQRIATRQDAREVLPRIHAPTLVLSRRECRIIPPAQGRSLADHVAGARFVEIPGSDLWMFWETPEEILDQIEQFLTGKRSAATRKLLAVLFTDIVGSTERAARIGDAAWRKLLDLHDEIVNTQVARFDGTLVDSAGDGMLATFATPDQALDCATALHREMKELGLGLRAGVHFGQVELRLDGRVGGIAVHLGARVTGLAGSGEVLASRTVRDTLLGSRYLFEDRGSHELKGVPGPWQVYALVPEKID
jgi:class 3 adenylate cyclase/pimeloyl-ACP methyl ester carboxylesterase